MKAVRIVVLLLAVSLLGIPITSGRALPQFDALFAFGDSLSDIGNDFIGTTLLGIRPAIPPSMSPNRSYYFGRFSNGPVAVEYLWYLLSNKTPGTPGALEPYLARPVTPSRGGLSLAFGGSGTGLLTNLGQFSVPGLRGQVTLFAVMDRLRNAPSRSLYVVMSGANDYLPTSPTGGIDTTPAQSVGNIVRAVRTLYLTGARHIMVVNLPDLGAVPLAARSPDLATVLTLLSNQHNVLLAQALNDLRLPGATLYPVDINGALGLLPGGMETEVPALAFLLQSEEAAACLFIDPATCQDVPTFAAPPSFFYWDVEHPTTTVHAALGQHMFNALP